MIPVAALRAGFRRVLICSVRCVITRMLGAHVDLYLVVLWEHFRRARDRRERIGRPERNSG